MKEIEEAHRQFKLAVKNPADISDPVRRKAIAPQAIPPLKTMATDYRELAIIQPQTQRHADQIELKFDAFLAVLGDQETINHLQVLATSKDLHESLRGQSSQLLAKFIDAAKDEPTQEKLTDELQTLDRAHAESEDLTSVTVVASQSTSSKSLEARLIKLASNMQNPIAEKVRSATR